MCSVSTTFGQTAEGTFTARLLVGEDSVPPSAPTDLSATGVALSQINLTWTASTDDAGDVDGYHVWRDTILIATTTGTSFSDIGLSSSTSYTYYVTAFDSSFNESASSTEAIGTTLTPPPPPPPPTQNGGQQGSRLVLFDEMITSLEVHPQKNSVSITYTTESYVKTTLQWGRGISYELGSLAEQSFLTTHETSIVGLIPGTTYVFTMSGEDRFGRHGLLYTGSFTTLPPDDVFPPGNVTVLTAERYENDILLSWINPEDPDFAKVRIVRNNHFYPSDVADGWVVYEGDGQEFRDTDAAIGTQQFYTVFTYDGVGNISSGAVVSLSMSGEGTTTVVFPDPTKNESKLSFEDLIFTQEGTVLQTDVAGQVRIEGAKQLTLSIPYMRLPEHLKTILVTIKDTRNNDRTFSFLLRVNDERTVYTGTLAPLGVDGDFPFSISVFDYTTAQIGYVHGSIVSSIRPLHTQSEATGMFVGFLESIAAIGKSYLIWFIFLLVLLLFMSRRLMHTKF